MSNKVPQIRFNGYSDAWVQRKAKDLFIPVNERNREDLPVLSVTQDQGVVFRNDLAIDIKYDESTLSSYKVIHPGDFIISLRSFQGGFELSNVLGISSPAYTIFDFAVPAEQDKLYWKTIFKTFKFIESLKTVTFGIRDGKSISFKEFGDLKLNYPSDVNEQRRIGEFFAKLDETIAANQRKLDLLKEQKKGYLQKMFPKNGAKVPELRFAGFADAWEDRKLKDVTERVRSNDGRMDLPTLTMSASSGWLDQKDRFSGDISGKEKKNYTLLKKGELSYNHGNSKLAKYGVVFSLTNYEEALVPRVYHSFKALENTSADFIEYMFSTKLPDRELGKLVSSGARMDGLLNINYDDFMNIHISIPNYEEQILMSAFFRKLDETIALHQRKLDLLKEQKKGFLEKMFV